MAQRPMDCDTEHCPNKAVARHEYISGEGRNAKVFARYYCEECDHTITREVAERTAEHNRK